MVQYLEKYSTVPTTSLLLLRLLPDILGLQKRHCTTVPYIVLDSKVHKHNRLERMHVHGKTRCTQHVN